MNNNEWPLVFFTILSQLSLGVILSGLILWLAIKESHPLAVNDMRRVIMTVATGSMGVALVISFLHLASPLHSVFALSNVATSWLSREILLASLFFFTLALGYSSYRFNIPHRDIFGYLYLASCITGIIYIWSMSKLYMIPTVPAWNTPATVVSFFNTALLLGAGFVMLTTVFLAKKGMPGPTRLMHSVMFMVVAAAVLIHLANVLWLKPDLLATAGSFPPPELPAWIRAGQAFFLMIGFSILTYWFAFVLPKAGGDFSNLVYIAFTFLFLASIFDRFLFYASYYRIGI